MKHLLIIILTATIVSHVLASEITGTISTNPRDMDYHISRDYKNKPKFRDGDLVRVDRGKIFLVYGKLMKHIHSQKELEKHKKRVMVEASRAEMADYTECGCLDGELVRAEGTRAVYVLKKGKKELVASQKALERDHFGKRIFKISQAEMGLF